jgi:phosphoenolpyruvate mutase
MGDRTYYEPVPSVYVGMTADVLHPGLINIIRRARELGSLTVGLLTDEAVAGHKRLPALTWQQRKDMLEDIIGVDRVVSQDEWDYSANVLRYRPDYFVHGDDWLTGPNAEIRAGVVAALESYGGELVEVPYTKGFSASALAMHALEVASSPHARMSTLRRTLRSQRITRVIQVHSPLAALAAESARVELDGEIRAFDAFWSSSLADSADLGLPDNEILDQSTRLENVERILNVTTRPLIFDADTGGPGVHFEHRVRMLEQTGVAAVVIEDKTGLKQNSLLDESSVHEQEDIELFSDKIAAGKEAQRQPDFQIFARIESFILGRGLEDALTRAAAYCGAGADGILVHSKSKSADEVVEFARVFKHESPDIPLICVPTTYHSVLDEELAEYGFNMVIYANHLLRAAFPAMERASRSILRHGRSSEIEHELLSVEETLQLGSGLSGW